MSTRQRDPKTGLTPQQERFCRGLAKGLSQAAAYRDAYPRSVKWKQQIVYQRASELAADGKVLERISALQAGLRARTRYELAQAMRETDEALELARELRNASAFVSVVALRAKLNGLMVEDRKNERRPYQDMTDAELDAEIERALDEIEQAKTLH